ncbi:MAG: tRNA-uridine aminocarboxypropyltransferase, partial [Candidatus Binatia bacterium]
AMVGNLPNVVSAKHQQLPRGRCRRCRRPLTGCYCSVVNAFESWPRFVVLTHPKEARHSFGTGRMVCLCIENSLSIEGVDFSENPDANRIIQDPGLFSVVLYPGPGATNLSRATVHERAVLVPAGIELNVFVVDGTWKSARKMIRLSQNLQRLPFVCFDPPSPSTFRIRRQPRAEFYSTIEAVHQVIDLFASPDGDAVKPRPHDNLLTVFSAVVDRQLRYLSHR